MATPEFRNGDQTHIGTEPGEYPAVVFNDKEKQLAGALQTQWINVPIIGAKPDSVNPSYSVWDTELAGGTTKGWVLTQHSTVDVRLFAPIPGSQIMRHRSEIIGARIYIGGAFSYGPGAGAVDILSDIDYSDPGTGPVPAATEIWEGSGPGAGSYAVHTVDWSSAPEVIDQNLDYSLRVSRYPAGSGTMEYYGAQLRIQFPITANP